MNPNITRTIYPVGLLLKDQTCLLVGGGKVAARKADGLLEAEAAVTVISPELDDHLARLAATGNITHLARAYAPGDTTGYALVFAATGDRIELLAVKAHGQGTGAVLQKILGFDALPADSFYVKKGSEAFAHTALLAAGLLSQVTGENQIVAQIKEALAVATQHQWAGGMLNEWIATALHISKEIRQAIPQDWLQGEIEDAAIQYLLAGTTPLHDLPPAGLAPVEVNVVEKEGASQMNKKDTACTSWKATCPQPTRSVGGPSPCRFL